MKKLLLVAVALLAAAFIISATLSVGFLAGLDQIWTAPVREDPDARVIAVLLPAERDPFWDDLVAALRMNGVRQHLSFEVTRYSQTGSNAREVIEKASLSRVDALLCYPPDGIDITDVVNAADSRGLAVLLLENDLPNSRRRVFLGSSSFQVGHEVGRIIRKNISQAYRGGVLLSQSNRERQTVRNSLFLNGLDEGLSGGVRSFDLVEAISPPGRFAGEELVWSLLRREPAIQVLVTTNPKDTVSALQTIVEANKVGKTRLVGVGEEPSLRTALAQGMVAGLIVRDAGEWAGLVTASLQSLLEGQTVSSYINLPVHSLTASGDSGGD